MRVGDVVRELPAEALGAELVFASTGYRSWGWKTMALAGLAAALVALPWNWFRGAYAVDAMVSMFETAFGKGTLNLLPERTRFIFCGTDMAFGASFIFDRDRVGPRSERPELLAQLAIDQASAHGQNAVHVEAAQ